MTNNIYVEYYKNQAGSGLTKYEGLQYQRGHGFFGTLFSNIIKPLGKYLGKRALETGVKLGSDVLNGENFKDSLKNNLKRTGTQIIDDGSKRAKKYVQTGSGKRKKRRRSKSVRSKAYKKANKRTATKLKKSLKKKTKRRSSKRKLAKRIKKNKLKFANFF